MRCSYLSVGVAGLLLLAGSSGVDRCEAMSSLDAIESGAIESPALSGYEIPSTHWTYKLAQKLANQTGLYQDNQDLARIRPDGTKPLTRTEMGVLVADLSEKMATIPAQEISDKDRAQFEILQEEFRAEMNVLRARIEKVENTVGQLSSRIENVIEKNARENDQDELTEVHALRGPIRIFGRMHAWYTAPFDDDLENKNFRLRRIDIGVEGKISKNFQYQVMVDPVRSERILKNLMLEYTGVPHHTFRIGQFKPGITLDSVRSSSRNFTSERSQIGVLSNFREQGAMVLGEWKHVNYNVGLFNGGGENVRDENRRLAFFGRVDVRPLLNVYDKNKWGYLQLGGSVFTGQTGTTEAGIEARDRYGLAARYVHHKFEINSEYLRFEDADVTGNGYYVEGVYKLNPKWHLVARYDALNPDLDTNGDSRQQYVLGVNHYIDEVHVRTALEYWYFHDPLRLNHGNAVRLLVQYTF